VVDEVKELLDAGKVTEDVMPFVERGFHAVEQGVNRVHIMDGTMRHALLVEFFSIVGVGTIIISDRNKLYSHEL
jgi:acetylglutamate kinase